MKKSSILNLGILIFAIVGMIIERLLFGYEHGIFNTVPYSLFISLIIATILLLRQLFISTVGSLRKILALSIVIMGWLVVINTNLLFTFILVSLGIGYAVVGYREDKEDE